MEHSDLAVRQNADDTTQNFAKTLPLSRDPGIPNRNGTAIALGKVQFRWGVLNARAKLQLTRLPFLTANRMKLEVENSPTVYQNGNVTTFGNDAFPAPDHLEMLNHGIRSAQAGNRSEARTALFKVTEIDPRNESAWLWLASISEYPEELLVFLNNVLEINPNNERAKEWTLATNSLLAKTFVQRGIDAVEGNRKDFAAECFNRALEYDQSNEMAWMWMASLSPTDEGKLSYLEMVLKLNPTNDSASRAYKEAKAAITGHHLSAAKTAAALGQKEEASELLKAVIEEDPDCEDAWMLRSHFADTFEEKISSFRSVLRINPENAVAKFSLDSLQSLMGPGSNGMAPAPQESANDSFGMISGTDLFAYEPEIARSPTQDLELPAENLDEIRDFAERNGANDALFVEQPTAEVEEEPALVTIVEQPVSLAEQEDAMSPEEAAEVEFELAPIPAPETDVLFAESVPESPSQDTITTFETSFDNDLTIGVTSPETFATQDNLTTTFRFEENIAEIFESPDEAVSLEDAAFSPSTIDAPEFAAEPEVGLVGEAEAEATTEAEVQDSPVGEAPATSDDWHAGEAEAKTEEMSIDSNDFISEQILIEAESGIADQEVPSVGDDDPFATVAAISIPQYMIPEPQAEAFAPTVEPEFVRTPVAPTPAVSTCSFCSHLNETSAISCGSCFAILTVSDLDMIVGNNNADTLVIRSAVERMEEERKQREFTETELTMLGIGHLNLQNLQLGYNCLHEASKLNPNNVVLSSQVNALLIRLEDVRKHDETLEGMSKGKSILVVDDSPTVRKLIAGKLEKSGHNVFCSADGVEAIEMLAGLTPDLILLDINMPRMDGYQTCKSIRSNEGTKNIPVVMISGKDGFFDKVRGRMAGTTGYITKPFGPETLMKTVETYLSGNSMEEPENEMEIS